MDEQLRLARYFQGRIDLYSGLIRLCEERARQHMAEKQLEDAVKEIVLHHSNQMVLKEILTISIEVLDTKIWWEYIHCDPDVQEPLKVV